MKKEILKPAAVAIALLYLLAATSMAAAQDIKWHGKIAEGMTAAKSNSRRLLIFFSSTGADSVKHYERVFREPQVARELAANYECVRLDFAKHREIAAQMHVFRAGIITLYQSNGTPIDRITDLLDADEFLAKISPRPIAYKPTPGAAGKKPVSVTPKATPEKTPVAVQGTPPPPLPKGKKILGPVTKDIKSSNPLELGVLEKGKKYVLVLEGLNSPWSAGTEKRADALYMFNRPTNPGLLELSGLLRFLDGNKKMIDYIKETTGTYPVYRKDHKYEVQLTGRGKMETLYYHESSPKNFMDNSGEMIFTLYEGK